MSTVAKESKELKMLLYLHGPSYPEVKAMHYVLNWTMFTAKNGKMNIELSRKIMVKRINQNSSEHKMYRRLFTVKYFCGDKR